MYFTLTLHQKLGLSVLLETPGFFLPNKQIYVEYMNIVRSNLLEQALDTGKTMSLFLTCPQRVEIPVKYIS